MEKGGSIKVILEKGKIQTVKCSPTWDLMGVWNTTLHDLQQQRRHERKRGHGEFSKLGG